MATSNINKIIFSPEDSIFFNAARLLIFFRTIYDLDSNKGIDLERLIYYEFFSANPFLVFSEEDPEWLDLQIFGFEIKTIEYLSSSQIYQTRRTSMRIYLSFLLSRDLIFVSNYNGKLNYYITNLGLEVSNNLNSFYSIRYRKSISLIIKKLKNYSDKKLWEESSKWLEAKSFQVDLYDMVDSDDFD